MTWFRKENKILAAIENGESAVVDSLLSKVENINKSFLKPDDDEVQGWTYLIHACKYGNSDIVELLLKSDADLNVTDSDGKPLLYWAACNEDDEEAAKIGNLLIERGTDVNQQAKDGRTALVGVVLNHNVKALELLLKAGADPNLRMSKDGRTALVGAVLNHNVKALELLLKAGADPNLRMSSGITPLYALISSQVTESRMLELVNILLINNADPNIPDETGCVPIFAAVEQGSFEIVKALVEGGADVNHIWQAERAVKPLDFAAIHDQQEIAKYLVSVDAEYTPGETELEIKTEEDTSYYIIKLSIFTDFESEQQEVWTLLNDVENISNDNLAALIDWLMPIYENLSNKIDENYLGDKDDVLVPFKVKNGSVFLRKKDFEKTASLELAKQLINLGVTLSPTFFFDGGCVDFCFVHRNNNYTGCFQRKGKYDYLAFSENANIRFCILGLFSVNFITESGENVEINELVYQEYEEGEYEEGWELDKIKEDGIFQVEREVNEDYKGENALSFFLYREPPKTNEEKENVKTIKNWLDSKYILSNYLTVK